MATDKASMKIRIKEIGQIILPIRDYRRDHYASDFENGYDKGRAKLAYEIRCILTSPPTGHTPKVKNTDLTAEELFMKQKEDQAKQEWRNMEHYTKEAWGRFAEREKAERQERREAKINGEGTN